jgi:hypothetical protein
MSRTACRTYCTACRGKELLSSGLLATPAANVSMVANIRILKKFKHFIPSESVISSALLAVVYCVFVFKL